MENSRKILFRIGIVIIGILLIIPFNLSYPKVNRVFGYGTYSPPMSITNNGKVIATRSTGGRTTLSNPDGGSVTLLIPSYSVSYSTEFTIIPSQAEGDLPSDLSLISSHLYEITAKSGIQKITSFQRDLTLTFNYTDEQIEGFKESSLKVYFKGENNWEELASTVDLSLNKVTVKINHLTLFALLGEKEIIYLKGDINEDGFINDYDFSILLFNWGSSPSNLKADLNDDGVINDYDFSILMHNWS